MKVNALRAAGAAALKNSAPNYTFKGEKEKVSNVEIDNKEAKKPLISKKAAIALAATAAVGVSLYAANKKGLLNPIKNRLDSLMGNRKLSKEEAKPWIALAGIAGLGGYSAGKLTKKDTDVILEKISLGDTETRRTANEVERQKYSVTNGANATLGKYLKDFYGLSLLIENNIINRDSSKYEKAIETIEKMAFEKLTSPKELPRIDKENPTVWSITSEFAPVKEGGLGSVPPEIRNNTVKLNVDMPTFVPMYLNNGMQSFKKVGDNYTYTYKGKSFNLDKLIGFKMDTFQNGASKVVPVEFFLSEDTDEEGNKRKLVFIKTDGYFDGSIYEANSKTEEPEKFAVMSKAVYELIKYTKEADYNPGQVEIFSPEKLAEIKAPEALILNDWQASPVAALVRYKASMENAHGQLSDKTADDLTNMRIITIGHNVTYQGSTRNNNNNAQRKAATNNILNTLFDKYTYDIVKHAKVGVEKIDENDKALMNLDNVLVINYNNPWENHTNLLNMGIILSDYFCPVSKNYAQELISESHPDLSYSLQWALIQKAKAGKLVGVINGNDFKNLSIEAKRGEIKKLTGVDFKTYNRNSSKEEILSNRFYNKRELYNEFMLPFTESEYSTKEQIERAKSASPGLEFYKGTNGTNLPLLKDSELRNTPILTMGGRLVDQKGQDIARDTLDKIYNNWDAIFPDKPKPIVYVVGKDGEDGNQRAKIEELKNKRLTKEDSNRVFFGHGFAPMAAVMAGSDFFLMPSKFEPCGLTQSEALALATPVVASAVGGIVDTINRSGKTDGILTTKDEPLTAEEFYNSLVKALDIYFNDKEQYENMVMDALSEDFSWIQPNKEGPVYEYFDLLGIAA